MRPLVYHEVWAGWLLFGTLGAFAAGEAVLQAARQGGRDDPSYVGMVVGSAGGAAAAFLLSAVGPRLPGPPELPVVIGVALMWLGMVVRYWSVRVLGRSFKVTVTVEEGQELVDTGPYALVRHPSYTGMVLVYLGLGIALDSFIGAAVALVLPTAAVVRRIGHEEQALRAGLGERYARYAARTKRLVPGIW